MSSPLVSVCIITYNHRDFIRSCLDSVLAQETEYPYEIILGEDASSDGTREICLEYAGRLPDQMRLLLNSRDDVSYFAGRPTGQRNFLHTMSHATGDYIALLEGDDFWSDPTKLQRQVSVLEKRRELSGCFHACGVETSGGKGPERLVPPAGRTEFGLEDVLDRNFAATSSLVFRREGLEFPPRLWELPMGDWPLNLLNLMRGPYAYIDREMSVYRVHGEGAWSQLARADRLERSMAFYRFAEERLGPEHAALVRRKARAYRFRQSRLGRWTRPLRKILRLRSRLGRSSTSSPAATSSSES